MSQHKQESNMTTPTPTAPEASTRKARNGQGEVGYRHPPVHTRFKKGKSGNPNGRPVGRANAKTTMARVINETVAVREGDKTRKMTKLEAMAQTHVLKAMRGDARSVSIVFGLMTRMGLLGESESKTLAPLSEEDDAILDDYVRRHSNSTK